MFLISYQLHWVLSWEIGIVFDIISVTDLYLVCIFLINFAIKTSRLLSPNGNSGLYTEGIPHAILSFYFHR